MVNTEKKYSFFLVRTPLQYLIAQEAQIQFKIPKKQSIILFFTDYKTSQQQIIRNFDFNKWHKIYSLFSFRNSIVSKLNRKNKIIFIIQKFKCLLTLLLILKKYKKAETIFIGHIEETWMRFFVKRILYKNIVFLEDGVATLRIAEKRYLSDHALAIPIHHKKFKSAFFNPDIFERILLGKQEIILPKITFFTVYNKISVREQDRIIKNDFSYFKSLISNSQIINKKQIWFIGQPLAERNIISKETFIRVLKSIKHFYGNNFDYYYIAHRSGKTQEYIKEVGYTIKKFNNPIEVELVKSDFLPLHIGSISSAALMNIKTVFENKIKCFYISLDDSFYEVNPDSKRILEYYKSDPNLLKINYNYCSVNN